MKWVFIGIAVMMATYFTGLAIEVPFVFLKLTCGIAALTAVTFGVVVFREEL